MVEAIPREPWVDQGFEWKTRDKFKKEKKVSVKKTVEFGDKGKKWNKEFPSSKYKIKLDNDDDNRGEKLRIEGVNYKVTGDA